MLTRFAAFPAALALAVATMSSVALAAAEATPPPAVAPASPDAPATPAAPTEATLQARQVPLTPQLVEAFIASFPPLVDLADELDEKHPVPPTTDEEEEGPEYLLVDHLKDPEDLAQIRQVLAKFSFVSYADWANVAHSVSIAADAAEPVDGPSDLKSQKSDALAAIDHDNSLDAAQKAARRRDVESQFAALAAFAPLPGNVAVVKPYLERIRALGADEGE
jgi:hypothetical protein